MREIYYAIYRSSPIPVVLNTLLAESILSKKVKCTDKNVKTIPGALLADSEKTILNRIKFGQKSQIKPKHIIELNEYLMTSCFENDYLKQSIFFGLRKTRKFKKEIRRHLKISFNQNIVRYIATKDSNHLKSIVKNINSIKYPSFYSKESNKIGLYRDKLAMQRAAVDHRFGREHLPPGK